MNGLSLTKMAMELLMINEDFQFRLEHPRESLISDFALYDFSQIWSSTAGGFGGIGGQAITEARTYVLVPISCDEKCLVYFSGKFAYAVPYSHIFMEDVINGVIEPIYNKSKYLKVDNKI